MFRRNLGNACMQIKRVNLKRGKKRGEGGEELKMENGNTSITVFYFPFINQHCVQ